MAIRMAIRIPEEPLKCQGQLGEARTAIMGKAVERNQEKRKRAIHKPLKAHQSLCLHLCSWSKEAKINLQIKAVGDWEDANQQCHYPETGK